MNPTSIHGNAGLIPGLAHQVKDLVLLWLWYRPVATALIRLLAWEFPYATGAGLKRKEKKKNLQKGCDPRLGDKLLCLEGGKDL